MANILGCYSTERLTSTETPLCPWGSIETDPSDPGHQSKAGLFQRNGFDYPDGAFHVGLWKFEESEDYKFLVGKNLVGFEANPYVYNRYSKVTCDLYGFKSYNVALGDNNFEQPYFQSIMYYPEDRKDTGGFYSTGNSIETWQSSLDYMIILDFSDINNHNRKPEYEKFDFLNIDAEGAELSILKGGSRTLGDINYIVLETSTNDRFNNGSTLDNISEYLKSWGFKMIEAEDGLFNSRGWGDVFYAK